MLGQPIDAGILALLIPILAILGGCGIAFTKLWVRHRERMAMIRMGMHPDHPEDPADAYEPDHAALGAGDLEECRIPRYGFDFAP
jgi:hypothetical protein